ncbi:WD repeat-containing protein tag-125 [Frankliniella fusca]|uniref:WD repeat-containing protein tag-125 n=1 Tax=Frankliniella fusca TaxID=407009 RepID=A0AAE1LIA3_9NEOP|nr:WD repeat-containing protein tag-125 [Frankliniella fusca]
MSGQASLSPKAGKFKRWKLSTPSEDEAVLFVKFSPCSRLLGVSFRKCVKVFRLNYSRLACDEVLVYHSDFAVEDIKWSPNSKSLMIISAKCSYFVVLLNIRECDAESVYRFKQPDLVKLSFIDWVPNNEFLILVASYNICSFVHRICDGKQILIPNICSSYEDEKPLMSFSSDGKYLAAIVHHACSYHVTLLSTDLWVILWMKKLEFIMVRGLQWSQNFDMLSVLDSSKNLKIFDLSGECLKMVQYDDPFVSGFFCTLFSKTLFAATCVKEEEKVYLILLYNLVNWQLSEVLEQKFNLECSNNLLAKNRLAFSHCGNFLASTLSNDGIVIWDFKRCCNPVKFNFQNSELQWHPRKAKLACSAGNQILIWKYDQDCPEKGTKLYIVETEISPINAFFWSRSNLVLRSTDTAVVLIKIKKTKHNNFNL